MIKENESAYIRGPRCLEVSECHGNRKTPTTFLIDKNSPGPG